MGMLNLRQGVMNEKNRQPKHASSGGYRNRHVITEDPTGDQLILLPGEYDDYWDENGLFVPDPEKRNKLPYYTYIRHRDSKQWKLGHTCSAGYDPHHQQPCLGCFIKQYPQRFPQLNLKVAKQYCFNAIHLAWYHKVQIRNKDTGQPVFDQEGKPFMGYEPCKFMNCEFCQQGLEKVYARKVYLDIGVGHLKRLGGMEEQFATQCAICGGQLMTVAYKCPSCGQIMLDLRSNPLQPETARMYAEQPKPCQACHQSGFPVPMVECRDAHRHPTGYITRPRSLFKSRLTLYRQKAANDKGTDIVLRNWEEVNPAEMIPGLGKPLGERLNELLEPFDFDKVILMDTIDQQAKKLDIAPHLIPQELLQGAGSKPYGAPQQAQQPQQPPPLPPLNNTNGPRF